MSVLSRCLSAVRTADQLVAELLERAGELGIGEVRKTRFEAHRRTAGEILHPPARERKVVEAAVVKVEALAEPVALTVVSAKPATAIAPVAPAEAKPAKQFSPIAMPEGINPDTWRYGDFDVLRRWHDQMAKLLRDLVERDGRGSLADRIESNLEGAWKAIGGRKVRLPAEALEKIRVRINGLVVQKQRGAGRRSLSPQQLQSSIGGLRAAFTRLWKEHRVDTRDEQRELDKVEKMLDAHEDERAAEEVGRLAQKSREMWAAAVQRADEAAKASPSSVFSRFQAAQAAKADGSNGNGNGKKNGGHKQQIDADLLTRSCMPPPAAIRGPRS